jgi:hypothetical protein
MSAQADSERKVSMAQRKDERKRAAKKPGSTRTKRSIRSMQDDFINQL